MPAAGWRWGIAVALVLVLIYPVARWMIRGGEETAPRASSDAIAQAGVLLDQSLQHYRAGRIEACLELSRQAAKLDPNSARAFNNIGICAAHFRRWDEAILNTEEAISLDPDFQLARNNLAWIQQERLKSGAARAR